MESFDIEQKNMVKVKKLSRILRIIIFLTFILLLMIMSGNKGIVTVSSGSIKRDLNMSCLEYGFFGSLQSIGKIIGIFLFMGLLQLENTKLIICIAIIINSGTFFIYSLTRDKITIYTIRLVFGIVRIFPYIYVPIWLEQFGIKILKTIMITVYTFTNPIGHILGLSIATFNTPDRWQYSFTIIGFLLLTIDIIMLLIPYKYFSTKYKRIDNSGRNEKLVHNYNDKIEGSFFLKINKAEKIRTLIGFLNPLKNKIFIFTCYSRANILFILEIIHLFIKQHISEGLKMENPILVLTYFGTVSTVGSPLGGIISSIILTLMGGYDEKISVFPCIIFSFLLLSSSIMVGFMENFYLFIISLFFFYFFWGCIIPIITSYMITSVSSEYKSSASSLNLLMCNLIGNLPGPIFYGFINDIMKDTDPNFAWKCTFVYNLLGFISMLIACYFKYINKIKGKNLITEKNGKNKGQSIKKI